MTGDETKNNGFLTERQRELIEQGPESPDYTEPKEHRKNYNRARREAKRKAKGALEDLCFMVEALPGHASSQRGWVEIDDLDEIFNHALGEDKHRFEWFLEQGNSPRVWFERLLYDVACIRGWEMVPHPKADGENLYGARLTHALQKGLNDSRATMTQARVDFVAEHLY